MLQTYKAKLSGNHLEWKDEVPDLLRRDESFDVIVTLLDENGSKDLRPFGLNEGEFTVPDGFRSTICKMPRWQIMNEVRKEDGQNEITSKD